MDLDNNLIIKNIWYLVCQSSFVTEGKIRHKYIANERIAFWRDKNGQVVALKDNCPHRGIPLSAGKVLKRGNIQCCYHGWEFDSNGVCQNIPALIDTVPVKINSIKVKKYKVAELNGTIWVFISQYPQSHEEVKEPIPDLQLLQNEEFTHVDTIVLPINIDHSVIGLIDPAHVTFVHQSWFWRSTKALKLKTKRFEPTPRGFKMVKHAPSDNTKGYRLLKGNVATEIFFTLPGNRLEHISIGEKNKIISLTTLTPIDDNHTELNQFFFSSLALTKLLWYPLKRFGKYFIGQDVGVFNKLAVGLESNPQLMLVGEADAQARWYFDLKKHWKIANDQNVEFKNPLKGGELRWIT